jgi:hypothetical protein
MATDKTGAEATVTEEPGRFTIDVDGQRVGMAEFSDRNGQRSFFHTETSPYYRRMKGDVRFPSTEEAERAGYTAWSPRSRAQLAGAAK